MKQVKYSLTAVAASAVLSGCLFGCSGESSVDAPRPSADQSNEVQFNADFEEAQARLARVSHKNFHSWQSEDTTSAVENYSIPVDENFKVNDFAVDAEATVESDTVVYTLASAGADASGDGWILRVEEGNVVFMWRDASISDEWFKLTAGGQIGVGQWHHVRVERVGDLTAIIVNGKMQAAFTFKSDISNIDGNFTIGNDKQEQDKCHCHGGRIEHVWVEHVHEWGVSSSSSAISFDTATVDSSEFVDEDDSTVVVGDWIADWEFNSMSDVGKDYSGNGHRLKFGEGVVVSNGRVAKFNGKSGFEIDLTKDLLLNEFVVEARVKPTEFARLQNILVSEPPGRYGDGWIVRLENGVLVVQLRDEMTHGVEWQNVVGDKLALNEWTEIRVERSADSTWVYQNGKLTAAAAVKGDVSQLTYNMGLGYDAMNQAYHDRYFAGEMDYVRYGKLSSNVQKELRLIADWNFSDPENPGRDFTGNGHDGYVVEYEDSVKVDSVAHFDVNGGFRVKLSDEFKTNYFVVEARVKPAKFDTLQNIITAEPPGRYGDGWMLRVDNGMLTAQFRDEVYDDVEWQVIEGKPLVIDEWCEIRVERLADSIKVYQNGELTGIGKLNGDVSQLKYDLGLGYDAMDQDYHDRYFEGDIDYIRFYGM